MGRARSWAIADGGGWSRAERVGAGQRVGVGPSWAGSFAGPRGEREKGLGWVEFGFGFGLGFLFSFLFSIPTSNKV